VGEYDDLMAFGSQAAAPVAKPAAQADPYADLMQWGVPEAPSQGQSLARGALQGASLGFGDEASAAIDTAVSHIPGLRTIAQKLHSGDLPAVDNPDLTYQERREAYRSKNAAAQQANPGTYLVGELAGGLATTPLVPGGSAKTLGRAVVQGVKTGAVLGGANALGTSSADLTQGDVGGAFNDVVSGAAGGGALGGLIGGAGHVAAKALTGGAEKLRKWIGSDLIGETKGASTEVAKKMVRKDIEDIADVVTADPALDRAVARAQRQTVETIEPAIDAVDAKIHIVTEPRAQLWSDFDQELAHVNARPAAAPRPLANGEVPRGWDPEAAAREFGGEHVPETRAGGHATVGGATVAGGGPTAAEVSAAPAIEMAMEPGPAGVRAGDYVQHLENAIDELRATGKGSDRAVASELGHHVSELKTARDWGYQPAASNPEEAQILANLQAQRTARLARGEGTAEVDKAISGLSSDNQAWNPDHIVPAERLRADVTDLQKEAAQRMGAINGTPNYLRGREVASHGEEFLRGLMEQVGQRNPRLVADIAEHNRQYSALARMRDILGQRLEKAKASELSALGPGEVAHFIHGATKRGLIKQGTAAVAQGLVGAKRLLDRGVANAEASAASGDKFSLLVLDGLRKGLPLTASVAAAEEAGRLAGE
jgi:hypothetical protein